MPISEKLSQAFAAFDAYNANDPTLEVFDGTPYPKELLYARRMTARLNDFQPDASDAIQLAARSQHIGRWEIPRNTYTMDKKGYLQWRNAEKNHHAKIADEILTRQGFDTTTIEQVQFLLLKKELRTNVDTQLLEDVICLVFIEYYLEEFASRHEDEKVVDILFKTMKKMSPRGLQEAGKIPVSIRIQALIKLAVGLL
jgi:hypothetical protein